MNSLYRELAPVPDTAWEQIETEASQALKRTLAARHLVDFEGPLGWRVSSVDPGRTQALERAPHPCDPQKLCSLRYQAIFVV